MQTTPNGWTILDRERAVLTRPYVFDPKSRASANALVAKMPDGKLVVMSPPVVTDDAVFEDLAEFGEVGAVVANNGFHHLGQASWKARFPDAHFFAPSQAMGRIKKKSKTAPAFLPLSELVATLGDDVSITEVPNTKCGESWCHARVEGGRVWFTSDVLANMESLPKAFPVRQLFKWTGSAPGYRVFGLALKFIVKDKKAVLGAMRAQMAEAPPTIVVPGHGAVMTHDGLAEESRALLDGALS